MNSAADTELAITCAVWLEQELAEARRLLGDLMVVAAGLCEDRPDLLALLSSECQQALVFLADEDTR
jgi:dsRNA-specific ribonuclease